MCALESRKANGYTFREEGVRNHWPERDKNLREEMRKSQTMNGHQWSSKEETGEAPKKSAWGQRIPPNKCHPDRSCRDVEQKTTWPKMNQGNVTASGQVLLALGENDKRGRRSRQSQQLNSYVICSFLSKGTAIKQEKAGWYRRNGNPRQMQRVRGALALLGIAGVQARTGYPRRPGRLLRGWVYQWSSRTMESRTDSRNQNPRHSKCPHIQRWEILTSPS